MTCDCLCYLVLDVVILNISQLRWLQYLPSERYRVGSKHKRSPGVRRNIFLFKSFFSSGYENLLLCTAHRFYTFAAEMLCEQLLSSRGVSLSPEKLYEYILTSVCLYTVVNLHWKVLIGSSRHRLCIWHQAFLINHELDSYERLKVQESEFCCFSLDLYFESPSRRINITLKFISCALQFNRFLPHIHHHWLDVIVAYIWLDINMILLIDYWSVSTQL